MPKTKKQKDDLPAYKSFEEEEEPDNCSLCHESIDDRAQFGKWITFGNIKVHHLCCVSVIAALLTTLCIHCEINKQLIKNHFDLHRLLAQIYR